MTYHTEASVAPTETIRRSHVGRDALIRTLAELNDAPTTLHTGSVMAAGSNRDRHRAVDPYGFGVLGQFDRKADLSRRFRSLDHRSRLILFLWFVEDWPVTKISAALGVSRSHCYRLRDQALQRLEDDVA
jgi:DNA-directed RNA polymerase specialized sigma24 family protein